MQELDFVNVLENKGMLNIHLVDGLKWSANLQGNWQK
jgi:hypothetical protein